MSETILNDVSDTALWVAVYRARETERADALFRDPLAAKLAGERGQQIEGKMSHSHYVEWSVVIRTHIIDGYIESLIKEGLDTVVNIGAGLDTRPYRMNLPEGLRWIEIDFPHMIALKNERLAADKPGCRLERVGLDLSNEGERARILAKINSEGRNILAITEGVTPYLSNDDVASLAKALRAQPNFRHFITDYNSPKLQRYLNNPRRKKEMQNAPFIFNPPNWYEFYAKQGWRVREMKYIGVESEKLGRAAPHPWWVKLLFKTVVPTAEKLESMQMNGYALLEPII
jgi:methyltransferase (TIGR00027 family)